MASSACNLSTFSPVETRRPLKCPPGRRGCGCLFEERLGVSPLPRGEAERLYYTAYTAPRFEGRSRARVLLHRAVDLAFRLARGHGLALVPLLLASRQADL